MSELKAHHHAWVLQWRALPLDNWRMDIKSELVEFIPLGKGTPQILRYSDVDFKQSFMDITKKKAPLDAEPSSDTRNTTSSNLHATIADCLEKTSKEQSTMSNGFIKLNRSTQLTLLLKDKNAMILLLLIATRATRTSLPNYDLHIGEAKIGDYKACGLTYPEYRCAIKRLTERQIIAIRTTNKGTIAKLLDSSIFDINMEGEERTEKRTKSEQKNEQKATNKKKEVFKNKEKDKDSLRSSKKKFLDFIELSEEEHAKLSETHGAEKLASMLEILNNAIGSKGESYYGYKSHYFVLKRNTWVDREHEKRKALSQGVALKTPIGSAGSPDNRTWAAQFDTETSQWCVRAKADVWEAYSLNSNANISLKYEAFGFKAQVEGFLRKANLWK